MREQSQTNPADFANSKLAREKGATIDERQHFETKAFTYTTRLMKTDTTHYTQTLFGRHNQILEAFQARVFCQALFIFLPLPQACSPLLPLLHTKATLSPFT